MKSQILLDGESYLLTDRRVERRDDVFRRKLAHTDGAKVVDSRLDEWSYARTDGLGRGWAAERKVKMRGLGEMVHAKTERKL